MEDGSVVGRGTGVVKALAELANAIGKVWASLEYKKGFGREDGRVWMKVKAAVQSLLEEVKRMNECEVRVKVLEGHSGTVPAYKTEGAAGLDLAVPENVTYAVDAGYTVKIPLGICLEIPPGFEGQVRPRSSMALRGLVAQLGTIDSDYRGEVAVILHNASTEPQVIRSGERIAQLVIAPVAKAKLTQVDNLTETARGEGGFGSTGK